MDKLPFAAIIVSGGAGRRLGGLDKSTLKLGGMTLLDHVRAAVADASEIVVVGPEVQGGPAAAVSAGLTQVTTPVVATLAVDQPLIAGAMEPLRAAVPDHDVAALVRDGHLQPLAALWQRDSLIAALARFDDLDGVPMRRLFEDLRIAEVLDEDGWSLDIDTPADLETLERRLSEAE